MIIRDCQEDDDRIVVSLVKQYLCVVRLVGDRLVDSCCRCRHALPCLHVTQLVDDVLAPAIVPLSTRHDAIESLFQSLPSDESRVSLLLNLFLLAGSAILANSPISGTLPARWLNSVWSGVTPPDEAAPRVHPHIDHAEAMAQLHQAKFLRTVEQYCTPLTYFDVLLRVTAFCSNSNQNILLEAWQDFLPDVPPLAPKEDTDVAAAVLESKEYGWWALAAARLMVKMSQDSTNGNFLWRLGRKLLLAALDTVCALGCASTKLITRRRIFVALEECAIATKKCKTVRKPKKKPTTLSFYSHSS